MYREISTTITRYGFLVRERSALTHCELDFPNVPQMARKIVDAVPKEYLERPWREFVVSGAEFLPNHYAAIKERALPLNPDEFLDLFDELSEAKFERSRTARF
jgi:hypothetical protein